VFFWLKSAISSSPRKIPCLDFAPPPKFVSIFKDVTLLPFSPIFPFLTLSPPLEVFGRKLCVFCLCRLPHKPPKAAVFSLIFADFSLMAILTVLRPVRLLPLPHQWRFLYDFSGTLYMIPARFPLKFSQFSPSFPDRCMSDCFLEIPLGGFAPLLPLLFPHRTYTILPFFVLSLCLPPPGLPSRFNQSRCPQILLSFSHLRSRQTWPFSVRVPPPCSNQSNRRER